MSSTTSPMQVCLDSDKWSSLSHLAEGVIAANPAARLGRVLKLTVSKATTQEEIKAMTEGQRQLFLAPAYREAPRYYPLFFVLAGTGMRLGEGLALQPEDLDCSRKTIRIARAFSEDGALDTPKSGHGRTVDISQSPANTLAAHEMTRKLDKLKYGWAELPPWLFVTKTGMPVDPANVRRAMLRVLKATKLPLHFTPHGLRHTYASILLADGVSPVYGQEQLGHATIELTVSTYGRWLKKKRQARSIGSIMPLVLGVVAEAALAGRVGGSSPPEIPYIQGLKLEPAIRIERTTCGLRMEARRF
jgi:integrase